MQRRGFLGWLLGAAGFGASVVAEEPKAEPLALAEGLRPIINGVGVLRHPSLMYMGGEGEAAKSAQEVAESMAKGIGPGSVLVLPSDRDSDGQFLWDFKIEGGDPGQVRVKRQGESYEVQPGPGDPAEEWFLYKVGDGDFELVAKFGDRADAEFARESFERGR